MQYLNLETRILHASEYIGADPTERATWLNLMLWCAEQENGGIIRGAVKWSDRRWQQTCGVTAAEVKSAGALLVFIGDDVQLAFYPLAQQEILLAKRMIARQNGLSGGRPPKPTPEPILEPTSESVKEGKGIGRERKKPLAPAKPPRARNELIDALALIETPDLAQATSPLWVRAGKALGQIKEACRDVTPEEITRRASNYKLHFPRISQTALGLAGHWGKCDQPPKQANGGNDNSEYLKTAAIHGINL